MTRLSTENLSVGIQEKCFVHRLSMTFNPGEIWGIFGPNGAGKTTLLHTLAGLLKPQSGAIMIDSTPIQNIKPKERAKKIGVLFQDIDFPFPSTVLESAMIGRFPYQSQSFYHLTEDQEIALEALASMNLTHFLHRNVQTLSGGEKRRLAIATLLTQDPQILMLDEPTNHLDIEHQVQLLKQLKTFAKHKNKTIIMILHNLSHLAHYCDKTLVFNYLDQLFCGDTSHMIAELKQKKPHFFDFGI